MKVLVATDQSQGAEAGDFCWTLDGELVLSGPSLECDRADDGGCGRGFAGLGSCRATTTAMVVDRPEIDRVLLADVIHGSLERQGWQRGFDPEVLDQIVEDEVEHIELITSAFPVGAVIGRDGTEVWERARRVV